MHHISVVQVMVYFVSFNYYFQPVVKFSWYIFPVSFTNVISLFLFTLSVSVRGIFVAYFNYFHAHFMGKVSTSKTLKCMSSVQGLIDKCMNVI